MRLAQSGEPQRFGELMRRHREAMLRFATARLGSASLAEDAVQETFLAGFRGRQTFDHQYRVRTWLWTILAHECRRVWDRRRRMLEIETEALRRDEPRTELRDITPDERLMARERRQRFEQFLTSLPMDQARALRLRFYEGLTLREVAERSGVSLSTAKNRVRTGLERLAALCRPIEDPTDVPEPVGIGGTSL